MVPAEYLNYEDPQLVSLCLAGDSHAWETLVRRYRRLIWSIALKFDFSSADAADIFQTTCLIWVQHLGSLKNEERLLEWLITTTRRQCMRLHAQRQRVESTGEVILFPVPFPDIPDFEHDPETCRLAMEERQALRETVEALPEPCRTMIHLLYFENPPSSYQTVTKQLDIPLGSIAPTRARCLEKLRANLRRRGFSKKI